MSWLFSRALVLDCSVQMQLDLTQSVLSNWIGTADAFLHSDKMTDPYDVFSRYGMTFVPLTADRGAAELMLLLEGFLAKRLAQQQEAETTQKIYGLPCSG